MRDDFWQPFFFFFGLSGATSAAHGGSQARGLTGLNEARDRTQNLMVPSQIVSTTPRWDLPFFFFLFLIEEEGRSTSKLFSKLFLALGLFFFFFSQ